MFIIENGFMESRGLNAPAFFMVRAGLGAELRLKSFKGPQ
jgi:hypothetical protein